jgi:hypothetical protein
VIANLSEHICFPHYKVIFHNKINGREIHEIWSSCLPLVLYVSAADKTQHDHLMWYIIPDATNKVKLYHLLNYMPIQL